ncbi:glycerophosphodiester phosphodiesterase family protein [Qipengyuania sp. JC766]|uniref:glycerophosphodiester phosphodiesterase family protein n=1 Tax=Qipengyuania sp. JC766 TaxID=3232139 RepID=UPI00345AFD19
MLIIAHRGASGERPEHTLAAYERAIDQGADYVEPDLVVTKDGVLVARHENDISQTTDVAEREEFADRRRSKTIDGELLNGWFAEDFTLAELRSLRARERLPSIRPANTRFNDLYQVPTLEEIVTLVRAKEAETGRLIGIYPELKHPDFLLQDAGIDVVDLLLLELDRLGVRPDDPVFLQCFEIGPLRRLKQRSEFRLVQLMKSDGGPADEPQLSYIEMASPAGVAEIATYADAIGADLRMVIGDGEGSEMLRAAKERGLDVHAFTLRKENIFLPAMAQTDAGNNATGDVATMVRLLVGIGTDGVFTDDPGLVRQIMEAGGPAR